MSEIEAVMLALLQVPKIFTRVNKARDDKYYYEICCFDKNDEAIVIAAYKDKDEAYIREDELQRRAIANTVILASHAALIEAGLKIVAREPTDKMTEIGIDIWQNLPGTDDHQVRSNWRAMWDAAL